MNDKFQVSSENGVAKIILNPSVIADELQGKLSSEDIKTGMGIINTLVHQDKVNHELYCQCAHVDCNIKTKTPFRSIPNGSKRAPIMFVNKMPTAYEMVRWSSLTDTAGTLLSLILSKMNVERESVYCTDLIKCNDVSINEDSCKHCIESYLIQEIYLVQPKIIICNGIATLKLWSKLGFIEGLPSELEYGILYPVQIYGLQIKIITIYDLDKVLQKTGDEYKACKTQIWGHLLTAFKAL